MTKKLLGIIMSVLMATAGLAACDSGTDEPAAKGTVKLAYVNWSEGIAMTNLAAAVLEDKMGYEVELTMADVAPVFSSVASGSSDAFLDVWLPVTHASYLEEYGDEMVDLGISYENARLGLVVPAYVAVDSIEELNDNKDLFGGQIVGIDAGAGLMAATERAIGAYGLDYELLTGSGPAMTAALGKAIEDNKAIVVTGWAPHWMFATWELKILDDPQKVLGEAENIHKYGRIGLEEDMPEVADFLKNFTMTEAELGDLMGVIEESESEPLEVARTWMNEHTDLVSGWIGQ